MKHKNRNIQIISIYAVIIAAFLGSTVLFFRIHTSGLRNSIEAETKLFASLLSSTLKKEYPSLEAFEREGAAHLIQTTLEEHESELADLDVRIVSADGMVLAEDSKLHNSINDAALLHPKPERLPLRAGSADPNSCCCERIIMSSGRFMTGVHP